jgi:tRNA pseudouridine38-40 synthase
MERYQVILAYNGSRYKGFQRQAKARSVQGVVEQALGKLGWQGKSILAAGRTDTGAHAEGQVIAFDLEWNHDLHDLQTALNTYLPSDVVARQVSRVCQSFHPRHDASWRRYIYRLYCQPLRNPLLEPYAWRIWPQVAVEILQPLAQFLVGSHDFGAYGTPPQVGGTTIRLVLQASWTQEQPFIVFEITAQAFLYHMVRRLVFMQVALAQGKLSVEELVRSLETGVEITRQAKPGVKVDKLVHGLAPAQGLVLVEVSYPPEAVSLDEDKVDNNN